MLDYDSVLPYLIVGACPTDVDDLDALKHAGVTAILNLQSDEDFAERALDWPAWQAHSIAAGINLRREPIQDFDDEDLQRKLPDCVRTLAELVNEGHVVYVHCSAGVNRSPSVIIAYLCCVKGWCVQEAEQHVRQCRDCSPVMPVVRIVVRDMLRRQ
jgi:protein-tyrosine phosphatase